MLIIIWLIIGIGVGAATTSFMDARGSNLGIPLGVIAGIVGAVVGGFIFIPLAMSIIGDGIVQIASFLAAAIAAFVAVMLARLIKR